MHRAKEQAYDDNGAGSPFEQAQNRTYAIERRALPRHREYCGHGK